MKQILVGLGTAICMLATGLHAAPPAEEQGSSSGQPFQSINQHIDEVQAALEAELAEISSSLQNDIDCINDYLNGTAEAANPETCPDFSESLIEDLQAEVTQLQRDLDTLEGKFATASCPAGYSLASLDPVRCERDDVVDDRLFTTFRYGNFTSVPRYAHRYSRAFCPYGFSVTGCSVLKTTLISGGSVAPLGNSCYATAYGYPSSGSVRAIAHCGRTPPGN